MEASIINEWPETSWSLCHILLPGLWLPLDSWDLTYESWNSGHASKCRTTNDRDEPSHLLPEQKKSVLGVHLAVVATYDWAYNTLRKLRDWLPLNSESQPSDASSFYNEKMEDWGINELLESIQLSQSFKPRILIFAPYHTLPWKHLSPLARNSQFYKGLTRTKLGEEHLR